MESENSSSLMHIKRDDNGIRFSDVMEEHTHTEIGLTSIAMLKNEGIDSNSAAAATETASPKAKEQMSQRVLIKVLLDRCKNYPPSRLHNHPPPHKRRRCTWGLGALYYDDPNNAPAETIVSVYRINDLSNPKFRFEVYSNAIENRLAGCGVFCVDGISVVVVGGRRESIERYKNLMLRRIDWAAPALRIGGAKYEDEDGDKKKKPENKCVLVWQESVAKPSFNRFRLHECKTEAAARKLFLDAGVTDYWDLAVNFSSPEEEQV